MIAYTSFNIAYLDRALVLVRTLREWHPDWEFAAVLVDQGPGVAENSSLLAEFDEVILARDLGIADFDHWIRRHDVVEACTAVKGRALQLLLERGHDKVVYLDPDMAVLGPLDPLVDLLDEAPIVLTPHLLEPEVERWAIDSHEVATLRYGIYNFGCYAVRNDQVGREFAGWWASRLYDYCVDDAERGLFTDQRWGDHVPVFWPQTQVCRDPGINIASWNLTQRPVELEADEYVVSGQPVRLFHFTKARSVGIGETMRSAPGSVHVAELWRWYLDEIDHVAGQVSVAHPWAYGSAPIPSKV